MLGQKNSHSEVKRGLKPLFPRLWRYCVSLTGSVDRADDLAQAVCLRAIERAEQFEVGTKLDRWVFTIAQRLWINELRKQAVRQGGGLAPIEEIEIPDSKAGPDSNLLAREVLLKVLALPEAQRVTVMLVYVEGYSYKEASNMLDIPIGTVMSRLSAARSKLARQLNDESDTG
ncbi:MAG: RNA polymerase sigma factor [Stappiaceae bacterium]